MADRRLQRSRTRFAKSGGGSTELEGQLQTDNPLVQLLHQLLKLLDIVFLLSGLK
jgi:hypothetical protein